MTRTFRHRLRGDIAADWTRDNHVLLLDEPGVEEDTGRMKMGDGVRGWNDLPYLDELWPGGTGGGTSPDADATTKGLVRLAGDLGGTAADPTVPGLATNAAAITAEATDRITDAAALDARIAAIEALGPLATDAEVAAAIAALPATPDATASVKGIVKLAGDLAGTAAAPTVPGVAVNAAAIAAEASRATAAEGVNATAITAEASAARAAEALKLAKASNLSDLADASAARSALGLGTAATQASFAFDAAGAAAVAQAASQPLAGHTSNSVPAASGSTTLADLAMGASTILARLAAGNIVAATPAQLKTLLAIAESDVTGLVADLAAKALASDLTTEAATARAAEALAAQKASNLSDLASAATSRTNLGLGTAATAASTAFDAAGAAAAAQSAAVQRANHTGTQAESTVTNLVADLALLAPLASPTFTGTVVLPEGNDAAAGIASRRTLGTGATQAMPGNTSIPSAITPWLINFAAFAKEASHVNFITYNAINTALYGGRRASSGAQNAEVVFPVLMGAGTWTFDLIHQTSADRGIYTVQLDGVTVGTIDGYAASGVADAHGTITGIVVASTGVKLLKLLMATKNGSSSAYYGTPQGIALLRTA